MDRKQIVKRIFPLSLRDFSVTLCIMGVALLLCSLLHARESSNAYVFMIFILAVFLVSRYTDGYLFGVVSALVSVLLSNYLFTYPYHAFNFSLAGYPLTAGCMLAVALITSALTTQIKRHSTLELEAEMEKARSNLFRAVSHDLRTPLTSILGASSAILDNDAAIDGPERTKLLREINEDAQWLIRMVENLLSVTRIDGGNSARIVKSPEAAEEVAAEAVSKFNKRFPELSVSVSVPDELLIVPMDAMLIEQVMMNLLENAALHAKGATRAELRVWQAGSEACFEVSDNGAGISREVLPHVFEGYFKPDDGNEADAKRNMGIGLSVCYSVVRAHGGRMTAENKKGGETGAVFRFTLPMEKAL